MSTQRKFKHVLVGLLTGAIVSTAFFPANLVLIVAAFVYWLSRFQRGAAGEGVAHLLSAGLAIAIVATAILLPLKPLDREIGPFRYGPMTLNELCQALTEDHHLVVHADRWNGTNILKPFVVDRLMTRRDVLQKLAGEADCDLRIGYCGTGATFLFGASPMNTSLSARIAQP